MAAVKSGNVQVMYMCRWDTRNSSQSTWINTLEKALVHADKDFIHTLLSIIWTGSMLFFFFFLQIEKRECWLPAYASKTEQKVGNWIQRTSCRWTPAGLRGLAQPTTEYLLLVRSPFGQARYTLRQYCLADFCHGTKTSWSLFFLKSAWQLRPCDHASG